MAENPLKWRPDLLGIYLNDHLAGATGGVELARRLAGGPVGASHRPVLDELAAQIEQDRKALIAALRSLDLPVNRPKAAAGWLGEKVARLKPNGRLVHRSPLSDLVELEAMHLGVQGKVSCWRVLRALADRDQRLNAAEFDRLIDRAGAQSEALESLRLQAAANAFTAPDAGVRQGPASADDTSLAPDTSSAGAPDAQAEVETEIVEVEIEIEERPGHVSHYSRLGKAVLDVPETDYDAETEFWQAALGQQMTELFDDSPEYRGAQVPGQDLLVLIQRLETGSARVHLDVHTDDLEAEVERLEKLGATRVEKVRTWWVMRDPAGLLFCVLRAPRGTLTDDNATGWP